MKIITKNDGDEISQFIYYENFFNKTYYNDILEWLNTLNYIKGYKNNGIKIDREQIWFDNNNNYFCKIWKKREERWKPHLYDNKLTEIQNKIQEISGVDINTCLVNKYNSGNDIISAHKDSSYSFGEYPNIIIYSLGSEREMKINSDKDNKSFKVKLKPNSLFIMKGASQKYFTHEIIKDNSKEVRYSLTFRKYIK
jgi:alkylated DNA repair dioxygenase AlkB